MILIFLNEGVLNVAIGDGTGHGMQADISHANKRIIHIRSEK